MENLIILTFAAYFMSVGFGVLFNGGRGAQRVTDFWLRTIRRIIAWFFDQLGNGLRAIGRAIR